MSLRMMQYDSLVEPIPPDPQLAGMAGSPMVVYSRTTLYQMKAEPPGAETITPAEQLTVDKWNRLTPDIVFDEDRRQYTYPYFFTDSDSLNRAETVSIDRFVGSKPDKIFDKRRQQYTYPWQFYRESQPIGTPFSIISTAVRQTTVPLFDKARQQYTYPDWMDGLLFIEDMQYAAKWLPSAPDVIFDKARNQHLYPSFSIDAHHLIDAEALFIDKWIGSRPDLLFDKIRRQDVMPDYFGLEEEPASQFDADWLPLANLPRWDVTRMQYAFPHWFSDPSHLGDGERITSDKWTPSRPDVLFDKPRTQYTYQFEARNPVQVTDIPVLADQFYGQIPDVLFRPKDRRYLWFARMPFIQSVHFETGGESCVGFNDPTDTTGSFGIPTPSNAFSSNDAYAQADSVADQLVVGGFGFSLPNGIQITSITVKVEAKAINPFAQTSMTIDLSWDGGTNNTGLVVQDLSSTVLDTVFTFDGASLGTTWGRTWTADELDDGNFVVEVSFSGVNSTDPRLIDIDHVQVEVCYKPFVEDWLEDIKRYFPQQPAKVFDKKRQQYTYPHFMVDPYSLLWTGVPATPAWIGSRPDIIFDKDRRQYLYPYLHVRMLDFTFDICPPQTTWAKDSVTPTAYSSDTISPTRWRDTEQAFDTWDDILAPITDTWDSATDTWDDLLEDNQQGNPPDTGWSTTGEAPPTTGWGSDTILPSRWSDTC